MSMADQRQNIINSVFSRRNAAGNLEESYVSHVKIWEDAGTEAGGRKPRYILLSRMSTFPTSTPTNQSYLSSFSQRRITVQVLFTSQN